MRFRLFALPLLLTLLLAGSATAQHNEIVAFGDPFPEIRLPALTDPAASNYLGIPD
jgi:hypothetical protein